MIKRILSLIILIPLAVVLITLSVTNRQTVTLALNPFDPSDQVLSVAAPFFVFLFAALMLGMVLGSLATWFRQGRYRSRARRNKREAVKWHREADKLKADQAPEHQPGDLPAIPARSH
ncbi:LapA family protein [Pseudohoeflea coraliihabitans]|uniref:LapA family protein n=1 Tax=Pseudohoeflea coraliihabitans TaxID=2860393 RepID=A0ABS6WNR1_9HYPH|nr:LapA family protein [Pseudohoeflea sp. DP4N28-3]MBW3097596.1 LapA family protein [Pseudohoeflea sp. DP4N28-3]